MATRRGGVVMGRKNATDVVGSAFKDVVYKYTQRDAILHALAVGVSTRPSQRSLQLLYEGHRNFTVFPTFVLTPAMAVIGSSIITGNFNGFQVDPTRIVLGEQYLEVFRPLSPCGNVISKGYIAEVLDKHKAGITIVSNINSFDRRSGFKHAFTQSVIFVRGHTEGLCGIGKSSNKVYAPLRTPTRTPDASVQEEVGVDQTVMFRLAGYQDVNPLHIDPTFARHAGYPQPLVHGLCLLGIAARHVFKAFCENDVGLTQFKAVKVRFTSPVYPGDTLRSDLWRAEKFSSDVQRIHLQMTNLRTQQICVADSYVDFHDSEPSRLAAKL